MAAKFVLIVLTFYIVAVLCESPPAYETKYDDINLDELLKNDRLRRNYVKCLLNEGPCTPDGQELKSSLPDAIATDCSKCTEKQKTGSAKVTHYLIDNQPDEWDRLAKVYDKDGEYKRKYLESKQNGAETNDEGNNGNENENTTQADEKKDE